MLHFEGNREYPEAPDALWAKLAEIHFIVGCIPGVESVAQADDDSAVVTLRPGFSFVRGTLEVTLRITERVPNHSLRVQAHSKGIGSTSDVAAGLTLTPLDGGTRLAWSADVTELGGLLKAVPPGLVKAAAQKVITDIWTAINARLTATP